ncbi:uncharacterized protein LOC132632713 isoform X2 [Lycium barbarum]|uniref:uncharacterized protein LOC132632713 isoform X2 n=1 Tax=Lycium barbarum TaxID=112863 RepID=UPI00293F3215|nr:uncharacterized protein LOC132632713 isoform X2 [Lycium barbarum]
MRMTALKRAYADIILNTAKEAAARIMSSEQKAVRYKHELKVAKEEAVGMLLRLKQMMDSKISESELTSLSQQRKIEELEAQLQEAEDIVNDLRVELREVQAELERVTSCKDKGVQNLEEVDTATRGELPEENRVVLPPESQEESVTISNNEVMNMKQKNQCSQSCSKMVQIGKLKVAGPDLPSIILRSKVPELYRNGCTQRIRACEANLLDGDLSVSKGVEKIKNENGDGVDEGKGICSASINKVDDVVNPQENIHQADDLLSSWHLLKSFRKKRRRAMRIRKSDYSSPRSSPDDFLNIDKTSNTGSLPAHSSPASDCAPGEDRSNMGPSLSIEKAEPDMKPGLTEMYVDGPLIARPFCRKRRRVVRNWKANLQSPRSSPDHLLDTDKTSNTGGLTASSSPARDCAPGEDPSQMGHSLLIEKAEPDMKLGFTEMYENELESAEISGVLNATVEDQLVMAKIDPPRHESRSLESLEVPVNRTDFANISSQLSNSLSKIADVNGEVPSQTLNDRVIKYTFQRKRKREQLNVSEENAPIEKSSSKEFNGEKLNGHVECSSEKLNGEKLNGHVERSSKELNGEKMNGHVEPKMSNSATESSRDSRRMAQVARQLISLSEKKWWK